jgi:hypothetical protein
VYRRAVGIKFIRPDEQPELVAVSAGRLVGTAAERDQECWLE